MANIKISAAADPGTLLSSDMLPLARSGDTNAYRATMAEIATFAGVTVASGSYNNTGRNLLHNPMFGIAQRGQGPFTATGYTLDRWVMSITGSSMTVTQVTQTDAGRAQIGDESSTAMVQAVFTGTSGAGDFAQLEQSLESVLRLSGKTVTISFWAMASAAGVKVGVSLDQVFGTGGSPSAPVAVNGLSVTLATTWARYTVTLTLPSAAGKVLGTNGDDHTQLDLWLSSGATNNTRAGGIGVQSGTVSFWGVQLEIGSAATQLEKLDWVELIQQAQRFYQRGSVLAASYATGGTTVLAATAMPVAMRAVPNVAPLSTTGNSNVGALTWSASAAQVAATTTATATGGYVINSTFAASADL